MGTESGPLEAIISSLVLFLSDKEKMLSILNRNEYKKISDLFFIGSF